MNRIIKLIIDFFMPPIPVPTPPIPTPTPIPVHVSKIDDWCEAIKSREGYFGPCKEYPMGTPSYRNNNPGNLTWIGQKFAVKNGRFACFDTYQHGYDALKNMLINACTGNSRIYKPTMTLYQFYSIYAPSSDNNDPNSYANEVAHKLGVPPTTQIKSLI